MDSKKEQIVEEAVPAATNKSEKPKAAKKSVTKSTAKSATNTTANPAAKTAAKTTAKKRAPKSQSAKNGQVTYNQQWYHEPSTSDKIANFLRERWYMILLAIGLIITNFVLPVVLDYSEPDYEYEYEQSQYDDSSSYTDESAQSSSYSNDSYSSTPDYSWLYGTWVATDAGDKHVVSFNENGFYVESFQSAYGSTSDTGSFSIRNGQIRMDSGDGYPAYIDIDASGQTLYSGGIYSRKRY